MKNFFSKLFGTVNDRKLKEFQPIVDKINLLINKEFNEFMKTVPDAALKRLNMIWK